LLSFAARRIGISACSWPGNEKRPCSDIPPLTDQQLAQFRRAPKVLIAARLDRDIYDWLRRYGAGYSTRINNILRAVMSRMR
jgi:uncharacterized protein (DUF4415 family)